MARRIQVTFDAADPHELARWWVSLLGYRLVDSHDRVARLLAGGLVTEADVTRIDGRLFLADFVAATDPDDAGPRLFFQRVPDSTTTGFSQTERPPDPRVGAVPICRPPRAW
jgi:hypothetical protein